MNFNSQICTTKEQSERLIALGLKIETADMKLACGTPAWSLHRLIDICPIAISNPPRFIAISLFKTSLILMTDKISYNFNRGETYDNTIDCIEWLIKERHFNKAYLIE